MKVHIFKSILLLFWIPLREVRSLAYRKRESFQQFFPDVKEELQNAVNRNCSDAFRQYQNEKIYLYGQHCVKTFSCIMQVATEYTKANFGSAGVLLGLTPTILATIGSSTPELALLSSRRPVLTFLIVLGSPAVNSIRAFNFDRLITDFKALEGNEEMYFPNLSTSTTLKRTCVLVEFLVAFASVANLVQISLVINRNTISIMSCDNSDMLVELWIGLALITHGLGILTFRTRSPSVYRSVEHWLVNEFSPCASHHEENVAWNEKKTKWFVVFSWFASVFTILHLAFGTIMFSSLFFVGTPYAAYIIFRFFISAAACRMIVAFELSGMRAKRNGTNHGEPGTEDIWLNNL